MRYVVCFSLVLLVHASPDCVTSHWNKWSPCLPFSHPIQALPDNVGQRMRTRGRVSGRRCILTDLEEVKLCLLEENELSVESEDGKEESEPVIVGNDVVTHPNVDADIDGNSGGPNDHDINSKTDPKVGSVPSIAHEPHEVGKVPNDVVSITVSTVIALGLALGVVGVVLFHITKKNKRQSKIKSVTRERIELLEIVRDPTKLHRSVTPSWLCGAVPVVQTGDLTVYNKYYLSESEGEDMPLGHLQINLSGNEMI